MKLRFTYIVVLFLLVVLTLGLGVFAVDTDMAASAVEAEEVISTAAPEDIEQLRAAGSGQLDYWAKNLARYDGRDFDIITPARNQGTKLICWAYAAVGAVEASILREGIDPTANKNNLDLDDIMAAYTPIARTGEHDPLLLTTNDTFSYSDTWNRGGNSVNAFAAMTQGFTLNDENTFASTVTCEQIDARLAQSKYYVQGYKHIAGDAESIKRAVLQYGAVTIDYLGPDTYRQKYYSGSTSISHASIIVGWDDNMDKNAFAPQKPSQNGAWIVKNSWGPHGYDHGGVYCFYMSYEEHIGRDIYAVDLAMRDDYQNLYYYDGGLGNSLRTYTADAQAAIFEAKLSSATKQEQLTAVSFPTNQSELNINVKVYKGLAVNPGNVNDERNIPEKGEPVVDIDVFLDTYGAHTIDFPEPIPLEQGEYFSIVVSSKSKYGTSVPIPCAVDGNSSVNDMTYYKYNGEWTSYKRSTYYADTSTDNMAVRIRAVTNTVDRPAALGNDIKFARVEIPNRLLFYSKGEEICPDIDVYFDGILLIEGTDYTVSVVDNTLPGMATLKISGRGKYSGTRLTYFEIGKVKYPPGRPEGTITVYNDAVMLYDIPLPKDWKWINGNEKLILGRSTYQYSLKYIGDDAQFYQIDTCDFYVVKLDEDPPYKTDISEAEATITGNYTYTGEAIVPALQVTCLGLQLRENIEYTLTLSDNLNAGQATAIIKGKGRYSGEIRLTFEIKKANHPKNLPADTLTAGRKTKTLDDVEIGIPDWIWDSPALAIEDGMTATASYDGRDKGNYLNTQVTIRIFRTAAKDIADVDISLDRTSYTYDGAQKRPNVIAIDGKFTLQQGVDYEVSYIGGIDAGQAQVIITGIDDYFGTATLAFTIEKASRGGITLTQEGWTYGDEDTPSPALSGDIGASEVRYLYSSAQNGEYSVNKPTDAGEYWIKATIGEDKNHEATECKARFVIHPKDISAAAASVEAGEYVYSGHNIEPNVTIYDGRTLLRRDVDYTLAYADNINAGKARIIVRGKGNYGGEASLEFVILKADGKDIDNIIRVEKFENLDDVALPAGFEWEEDSLVTLPDGSMRATARYVGGNYELSELVFEIFVDAPEIEEHPAIDEQTKDNNSKYLVAFIAPAAAIAIAAAIGVSIAAIRRRRLK